MDIYKFSFSPGALSALPQHQLSAFLLLGLFLNEANWLQKIILVSTLDQTGNEAEDKARLALSLMMAKVLAAKIHEGWNRLRTDPLKTTLSSLPDSTRLDELRAQLEQRLAKNSLIHQVRLGHAAHYPTSLSLEGLPGIAQGDVALYMTEHAGDVLSLISELSAVAKMRPIGQSANVGEALGNIIDELVAVCGDYCEYLARAQRNLVTHAIADRPAQEVICNADAPPLDSIHLRFFASPPTEQVESQRP
jgi:hypothetical protein